jgi:channel protein (hemolysin III family)
MDQADHAMIYVLIAGTYTPFALLAFDRTGGWRSLAWSGPSPPPGSSW